MTTSLPLFGLRFAAALLILGASSILRSQVTAVPGAGYRSPLMAWDTGSPSNSASDLPDAPGFTSPAAPGYVTSNQRGREPWEGDLVYGAFSRLGIGADVSPLGVGIKSATILSRDFDTRLLFDFFNYNSSGFEVSGIRTNASVHLFTVGGALDIYPHNSVWRLSAGLMAHNGNRLSATGQADPGQDFTVNGEKFYSAKPNPATGATPVTGSGVLGLHAREPELFVSGGFGRFVPHSERHWSFPAELGVVFMGAPTVSLTTAGWVCKNTEAASCSDLSSTTSPVSIQFNNALQAQLAKWRQSMSSFRVYPMFSYSVVYSFDMK